MRIPPAFVAVLPLPLAFLLACDSGEVIPPGTVVRDSAGVEIVTSTGTDRPTGWTFSEELRIGGAETGPASFTSADRSLVGIDAQGQIYVLDGASAQVHRFDATGRHLATLGRKGGGPGEFEDPASIGVSPDGGVTVLDFGKMSLVSWDSHALLLPERRWDFAVTKRFPTGLLRVRGDTTVLLTSGGDSVSRVSSVIRLTPRDTVTIDSLVGARGQMVMFTCVGLNIDKLFSPSLSFAIGDGEIATTRQSQYTVNIVGAANRMRSIRREIAPVPATFADARRLYPEGMKVSFGGDAPPCITPAEEVAEKVGIAATLPVISELAFAPDGSLWVQRHSFEGETPSTDVFDPKGYYVGTIVGRGIPIGFLGDDKVVFEVEDETTGSSVIGVFRIGR